MEEIEIVQQESSPIISAFTERISKKEEPIEPVTTEVADVIDINVSAEVMENEDYQMPSLSLLDDTRA